MEKQARKRQKLPFIGDVLIPADEAEERRLQRAAKDNEITRIAKGVYVNAIDPVGQPLDTFGPVALLV